MKLTYSAAMKNVIAFNRIGCGSPVGMITDS